MVVHPPSTTHPATHSTNHFATPDGMTSHISDAQREACTVELLHQALHARAPEHVRALHEQAVLLNKDLAKTLARQYRGRGMDDEDLEQVAYLALCKAVAGYREPAPGFTPYAVPTIRGELRRYFRDHGWLVRPPRAVQETDYAVRKATPLLTQELCREPTISDLARHLGMPTSEVVRSRLADRAFHGTPLEAPLGDSTLTLSDLLPTERDELNNIESRLDLRRALNRLSSRQLTALRLYYVGDWSQREIGHVLGVSQMQVSRILARAVELLRRDLAPRPDTDVSDLAS